MKNVVFNLLSDLRKWLIVFFSSFVLIFSCCYSLKERLYIFISKPIEQYYMSKNLSIDNIFIFTGIWELFLADIKICLYSSFLLSLPIIIFCVYKFLSPSLYKREKQILIQIFLFAIMLTIIAIIIIYNFIFPHAINFFLSQTNNITKPMLSISEYITAFFGLTFIFCLIFQTPIILFALIKVNILSIKQLTKHRRATIVTIFIVSAIITPPDISSQIFCAILLMMIYELTLLFIKITAKNKINRKIVKKKKNKKIKKINKKIV